jgi:hypothetical protein
MTGPVTNLPRAGREVEAALNGGDEGWAGLERLMLPAVMPDPFRPDDAVLAEMARYAETEIGARVMAWLRSVTDCAPYPHVTAAGFEQAALAAARHEGRAHVGHLITKAIADGQTIRKRMLAEKT